MEKEEIKKEEILYCNTCNAYVLRIQSSKGFRYNSNCMILENVNFRLLYSSDIQKYE